MNDVAPFDPKELRALIVSGHESLGRALSILLKAMGFGTVERTLPADVCAAARPLDPHFILFTPDYMTLGMDVLAKIGCPCRSRKGCPRARTVIIFKKRSTDAVITAKSMGFSGIIFIDDDLDQARITLRDVYMRRFT